ncbi:PadR family transcriptional regulator [Ekhidna sp.]
MKRVTIGEFEELCLLMVGVLHEDAYGVSVKDEIVKRTGRNVTISSIHSTLVRLEKKGLLKSYMGGANEIRGGRAKRIFEMTSAGKQMVTEARELRNQLWTDIPKLVWEK